MKINNKLFLITATLGLMAAGSATSFAHNHTNYIYVKNLSPKTINVTESWSGSHTDMYFLAMGTSNSTNQNLSANINPGCSATFQQSANHHDGDETAIGHSGIGMLNIQNLGTVEFEYHAYWDGANTSDSPNIDFNHLDWGVITANNANYSTLIQLSSDRDGQHETANVNQKVECSDNTHMIVYVGMNGKSSTASPMGKLSNMLQSFKL